MTTEEKAKAYDKALEQAKKELNTCGSLDCDAARQIIRFFPKLRESEKPLTPFQQCLNLILRKVYFASIPNTEDINKFILDIVKNHTSELVELAKKHKYTDYQLAKSEDDRIRKALIDALKTSKTVGELKFVLPEPTREECIAYLEKQKEQKHSNGCFTCDEYKKGYEEGRRNGFTAGYNKAMKQQKPVEWSEEDEEIFNNIIEKAKGGHWIEVNEITWLINRFKSLRPQYHGDVTMTEAYKMGLEAGKVSSWKPSEHQMTILKAVKEYVGVGSGYWGEALGSLIEDLEKLM